MVILNVKYIHDTFLSYLLNKALLKFIYLRTLAFMILKIAPETHAKSIHV